MLGTFPQRFAQPTLRNSVGVTRGGSRFSAPVSDYFARLDAAGLRVTTYDAANAALIDRLVGNGGNFWPDSGAFCAMAGYLYPSGGTLIPLKDGHDAGTLNAFVSGDWNAVTGLKGDGSTKFVSSGLLTDSFPQNDFAQGVWVSEAPAGEVTSGYIGAANSNTIRDGGSFGFAHSNRSFGTTNGLIGVGYMATSRASSGNYQYKNTAGVQTRTVASSAPNSKPFSVFSDTAINTQTAARLAFYNIGLNLSGTGELAELNSILTDWQTDLANA